MNIILFGETASTHFLSQELLGLENVSRVFHYGASPKVYSSSRYHPLFTLEKDLKKFILDLPAKHHFDLIFPVGLNYQIWKKFRKVMTQTNIPLILPDERIVKITSSKNNIREFLREAELPYVNTGTKNKNTFSFYTLCNNKGWRYIGSAKNYEDMGAHSLYKDYNNVGNQYVEKIFTLMRSKNYDTRFVLKLDISVDDNLSISKIHSSIDDTDFMSICPLIENNLAELFHSVGADNDLPLITFKNKVSMSVKIVNRDYPRTSSQIKESPQLWPVLGNVKVGLANSPFLLHSVVSSCDESLELVRNNIYNFLRNKPMGDYTYKNDIGYTI